MHTYTFYISSTHCPSCKIFIENEVKKYSQVIDAEVNLSEETLTLTVAHNRNQSELAKELTKLVEQNGYTITTHKSEILKKETDANWIALPIGLLILILFFLLQKYGLINAGIGGSVTPLTAFIIGIVASVSTCLAVIGGLILSLSAKISQNNSDNTKTIVLFHFSRLLSFAILGGIFGLFGNLIGVNFTITSTLGIFASVVMLILGLNLVGLIKNNFVLLPPNFFRFFTDTKNRNTASLLLGFGTFFLPCGFTQAMQISAISSGSFISGSLIMLFFALGTLPALSLLSFGANTFAKSKYASLFLKTSGVVVIGLAIFSILAGLAGLGVIKPLINI